MEHIYTIKVKRQFDPRGLYPSERRYSASTVRGLAWVHGVLAATCALLAALVLLNSALQRSLALPPGLLTAGAVAACLAAGLASRRWYIDRNITLFFVCSLVSTFLSIAALSLIVSRVVSAEEGSAVFGDFFTSENLEGRVQLVSGEVGDVEMENATMEANQTWIYIIKVPLEDLKQQNIPLLGEEPTYRKSHKVLSINILIAAAVEMLWSIISVALAWRGMRSDYPDGDPQDRRGPTVQVVTELKGNNTRHLPKNTRILPPRPDLIQHHHHPRCDKIRKFFRSQRESGGLFLQTGDQLVLESQSQQLPSRESSAQYRERMLTFLNGEAKTQEMKPQDTANSEITTISKSDTSKIGSPEDSLKSDSLNTTAKTECHPKFEAPPDRLSWGDVREYPVYDQNTLDLDKIRLTFERRKAIDAEKKKKLEESVSKVTEPNKEDIQHQEAQE